MRFPSLTCTLILFVCFSSCSHTSERVDSKSASNSASKTESPSVANDDDELKRRYQDMESEIKRTAEILAVENVFP